MITPNDPNERERKLHPAHLFALRGGPFFLASIGVYLVLIGTLAGKPETEAIATTLLGVVACVTAGVVTRAGSLEVDKGSVKAALAPVVDLDPGTWALVLPSEPPRPALPEGSTPLMSPLTVAELFAAAPAAGWSVGQTTGSTHATLTRTNVPQGRRWNAGDSITVLVPVDDLLAPVPTHVWEALTEAGFPHPTS